MLTLTIGTVKWNEIMMKKMGDPPKSSKFLVFNGAITGFEGPHEPRTRKWRAFSTHFHPIHSYLLLGNAVSVRSVYTKLP